MLCIESEGMVRNRTPVFLFVSFCIIQILFNLLNQILHCLYCLCLDCCMNFLSDIQKKAVFIVEGGQRVCGTCFRRAYKLNKNFFYKYLKKARKGVQACGVLNGRLNSEKRQIADVWLDIYAFYHADRMPDNQNLMLPYRTRKIDIYNIYTKEMVDVLKSPVSKSLFYDIWNNKKILKIKQVIRKQMLNNKCIK